MKEKRIKGYLVIILECPFDRPDDPELPRCYAETYLKAVRIARPWVKQGYQVAIEALLHLLPEARYRED